jgi:molybdopterin biosynthesis enzyme
MGGLAQANCLIVVPEEQTRVERGDRVSVVLLDGVPGDGSEVAGDR